MSKYYVNRRPLFSGYYAIHKEDCPFLANEEKRIYLGEFNSCQEAVNMGRKHFIKSNGCLFCSKVCSNVENKAIYEWNPV